MKIKNFLIIFTLFVVLLCGVSAISAAHDNAVDNLTTGMDDSISVSNGENAVGVDNENSALNAQNEIKGQTLNAECDELLATDDVKTIYVGHHNTTDGGNGSFDNPFTTFKAACDSVNGEDTVTINVFSGTYYLGGNFKFDTPNLNIKGYNGSVIIKNQYNAYGHTESFGSTSSVVNFTFSNIIFDASTHTMQNVIMGYAQYDTWFFPFYGSANLGVFNNCSFIGYGDSNKIMGSEYNSKFIMCYFDFPYTYEDHFLFYNKFARNTNHTFEYCRFNYEVAVLQTIYLPCNILFDNVWFGKNEVSSYIYPKQAYVINPDGTYNDTYSIPVSRYAIFNVTQNYLGDNQYEIVGKLTWNGTDDQDGMENFQPMTVTLLSDNGGEIAPTATLVNGTFKTIYRNSASNHKITATLDNQGIDLEFFTVNITADPVSIYYGEDQNITVSFSQVINSNVSIIVNNKTYSVKVNDSDSFTYTIKDVLKAGTYTINITLSGPKFFGFNSTMLTVSKVDTNPFDVVLPGEVKVGENAVINITLPSDVDGNVTVKFGNLTQEGLVANQTITVSFGDLNATTYDVDVTYSGSDKYTPKEYHGSLTVDKAESTISINDAIFTYGEVIAVPFNMTNANGVTVSVLSKDGKEVANASSESNVFSLDVLPAGEYTLKVTTVVDTNNYNAKTETVALTINKANSTLEISDKEFAYATKSVISAVTVNSTGDLIATLIDENNNEIPVTDVSGDNITLPLLDVGKYTLKVTTNVDENHNNATKSATITIIKTTPLMNVTVEPAQNITAKDNPTLTVKLPSTATGEVVIKVNGKKVQYSSANETITINLNNAPGDYIVDVIYSGDKNYESDSATKEFTISKAETIITAKQIDFEEGNVSKIEVTVPNVESGIVLVDVAGKKFYGDIDSGNAIVTIEGVDAGNYTANVKFFGDDKCKQATTTADVQVSEPKIITELKEQLEEAQANVSQLKDDLDEFNQTVAGKDAEISNLTDVVAGKDAEIAALNDTVIAQNSTIEAQKELISKLSEKGVATQFNVTEGISIKTYAVDSKAGEVGQTTSFKLTDSNGNPVVNATVKFAYKTVILNRTTDENGIVFIGINTQVAQEALCAMSYTGDEKYNATFVAFSFDIQKKPITITASAKTYKATAKTKKYTITLKTEKCNSRDGKVYLSAGKKVTLKLNGKTYTAKTNAKGQATFSLKITKKGKYTAKISFAGDKTYKSASKTVKITIK